MYYKVKLMFGNQPLWILTMEKNMRYNFWLHWTKWAVFG